MGAGGGRDTWSPTAAAVWGKTDRESDGELWLPLVRHLEDTAAVAGQLWDYWLSPNVRRLISSDMPAGETDGRTLVVWLAGVHDIGKATPGFAVKARNAPGFGWLLDGMSDQGLLCPQYAFGGGVRLPPHCRLGQFLVSSWLRDRYGMSGTVASALAVAIGAHHGVPPTARELQDLRGDPWTGQNVQAWRDVQWEILDRMAALTGSADRLHQWARGCFGPQAQSLASAVVVVADWLASDSHRFGYEDRRSSGERVATAGLAEALLGPWDPGDGVLTADELFRDRFPSLAMHGARPLQRSIVDIVDDLKVPSLLVVEAPMGAGKTEAALAAAERLAARFGCGGVFIGLPTMATSDAMFPRVLEWTRHLDGDGLTSTYLAHGKARLNEAYRKLVEDSRVIGIDEDSAAPSSIVTSWLRGRRQGVLANFVIGTIDQALFGALKTRHLALRHLALASKVVVIDEVHAADTYMRRYLTRVLEWLASYGTPVVLMSATLPPAIRAELVDAYARGRGAECALTEGALGYPMITVQGDRTEQHGVEWSSAPTPLDLSHLEDHDVAEFVTESVRGGACVAVVHNTVARAQDTYLALRERLASDRVMLLHSRFVATDRARLERRLLSLLGPPGPDVTRPRGFVVVGTQVIEQSLDIDVDVMVSDLAPVDLILQRAGRLHRHDRGPGQSDRPTSCREARLLICGVERANAVPDPHPGSIAVYGESALLRSEAVLATYLEGSPIQLPTDIPSLVEAGYRPDLCPPPGWEERWRRAESAAQQLAAEQQERAQHFRLSPPDQLTTIVGWLAGRSCDIDETTGGRAQVRDSEDGLEVVLVWRDGDGAIRLLPGMDPLAGSDLGIVSLSPPSGELLLAVASQTVRLPGQMTRNWAFDSMIRDLEAMGSEFMGWQQSPWLAGQLVLCLDANLEAEIAGFRLRYDPEFGLQSERVKEHPDG